MSLLPYPLAQHWKSPFGIPLGEEKNVLAPITAGPALEIAILNSFGRKKECPCSHNRWPSTGRRNLKLIWAKKRMSLLPCPLAQHWKSQFEINLGVKQKCHCCHTRWPSTGSRHLKFIWAKKRMSVHRYKVAQP